MKNGNGYVEEYRFLGLDFEGEYKNEERNGKGKEFYLGLLKLEGEFRDGREMEKEKNIMMEN